MASWLAGGKGMCIFKDFYSSFNTLYMKLSFPVTENMTCPDLITQDAVFDQKWGSEKLLNSPSWSPVNNCPLMVCIIDPGANLGN